MLNMETNPNSDNECKNEDNNIYLPFLADVYNENYRRFEEISLTVFHYLLSGSLSLLALLVPVAILVREIGFSTRLLILAGLFLSVSALLTIAGFVVSEVQCLIRKNLSQKWKEHIEDQAPRPKRKYKPLHLAWLVLAILAAVCFASAIVLLFVTLYQVFSA